MDEDPNGMWMQELPFLCSAKSSKLYISVCEGDCGCCGKNIVEMEVEPGPESSHALKLWPCSRGYRRAVQNKPLMQTQSSCATEPPNSWSASLEPWPASFHDGQSVNIWIIDDNLKSKEISCKKRRYPVKSPVHPSPERVKAIFWRFRRQQRREKRQRFHFWGGWIKRQSKAWSMSENKCWTFTFLNKKKKERKKENQKLVWVVSAVTLCVNFWPVMWYNQFNSIRRLPVVLTSRQQCQQ